RMHKPHRAGQMYIFAVNMQGFSTHAAKLWLLFFTAGTAAIDNPVSFVSLAIVVGQGVGCYLNGGLLVNFTAERDNFIMQGIQQLAVIDMRLIAQLQGAVK